VGNQTTSKEIDMGSKRFEATCGGCKTRITTADGGETWRHDHAPDTKHRAYASGTMKQI
jgi:hypothetical protein